MIGIQITDENEKALREFAEIQPGILDAALRATARTFRNWIRKNYLSGNPFHKRTGRMWSDFHYGRYRKMTHSFEVSGSPRILNIYQHSGGANIRPTHTTVRRMGDAKLTGGGFLRFPNIDRNPKFGEFVFVRYIHLPERQVMDPATARFDFQTTFRQSGEKLIEKAIKRRFQEASNG